MSGLFMFVCLGTYRFTEIKCFHLLSWSRGVPTNISLMLTVYDTDLINLIKWILELRSHLSLQHYPPYHLSTSQ